MRCLVRQRHPCFGGLKRERGGGATASIAVISLRVQYTPVTMPKSTITAAEKKKTPRRGYVHTMPLHYTEEFHHNLRRRANESLALSTALSIDDAVLQTVAFR
jgi:hypothetical protein